MNPASFERMPSAELLQIIGLVTWSWAMMETFLRAQLVQLIVGPGKQPASIIIPPYLLISGMNVRTVLGFLRSFLLWKFPGTDLAEFDKIRKRIDRLSEKRDLLVHSAWRKTPRSDSISAQRIKSVNTVEVTSHEFSAQELNNIADSIRQNAKLFVEFFQTRGIAFDLSQIDQTTQ